MLIILPDENRVDLASVVYQIDPTTLYRILFSTIAGGTTFSYQDEGSSAANAQYVLKQLDALRTYGAPPGATPVLNAGFYVLTNILPNEFDVQTVTLTITGIGFRSDLTYVLHLEDGVLMDNNDITYTVTWVSPTQMTAVFSSLGGGGVIANPACLYLTDNVGRYSNLINCTCTVDNTHITIP